MNDLIDKQTLISRFRELKENAENLSDAFYLDGAIAVIDTQPTAIVSEWILCKDGKNMPPEHNSMFAKLKGTDKWHDGMFERVSDNLDVTVEYDDGTRIVKTMYTIDGKWKHQGFTKPKVIAWRPKPEPYKGGECE